jgi:ubiquinone/menaquinone biosynthesis C-methylase UbiE
VSPLDSRRGEVCDSSELTVCCLRCRSALPTAPGLVVKRACGVCGAPVWVDGVAIDVVFGRPPLGSWGARAMQSRWLARVYGAWWRPVVFALSTNLRMPRAQEEAGLVLAQLAGTEGPWLDLSCGPGTLTRRLAAQSDGRRVVGVDLSRAMLERARRAAPGVLLVRADAAALPFADGAFGAVVNLAALDLYPDAARVIAESARVLAGGGRWVASTFVARRRAPRVSKLAAAAGVRTPTLDELAAWAARAGLDRFTTAAFGRYVVAWADKCRSSAQD